LSPHIATANVKGVENVKLSEYLENKPVPTPGKPKISVPKGWEPGVRFTSDNIQEITTEAIGMLEGEPDWKTAVEDMGLQIPEGYRVRLTEMRYDPGAWSRDDPEQKYAVTRPIWRYKFVVEPVKETSSEEIDGILILNAINRQKRSSKKRRNTGEATLVLNLNDTQIGKDAGGGTEATIERLDRYFDLAAERIKEVKNFAGDLVILMGGDLVEGCSIYPNQMWQIDRDRRAQIRTMTGITLNMLDRLAPEFEKARVFAVPGNHGEHRMNGKRVNRHDNDDQLVAEAVATASERDPALNHVNFVIAYDTPAITADIQGHILALTHGSVYAKSGSGSPSDKALRWYRNMAGAHNPIGTADILVGNHYHHEIIANYGSMLFVQNPAMDGGSPEFADYSGTDCPPGMATWLMTPDNRFTGYEILR